MAFLSFIYDVPKQQLIYQLCVGFISYLSEYLYVVYHTEPNLYGEIIARHVFAVTESGLET